jgi:hypothetical protein
MILAQPFKTFHEPMVKSALATRSSRIFDEGPCFSPPVAVELLEGLGKDICLLFSTEFDGLYKNGGIGTFYRQLARGLREHGWYVILINLGHNNESARPAQIDLDAILQSGNFDGEIVADSATNALLQSCLSKLWETLRIKCLAYCQATVRLFPGQRVYAEFHEMLGVGYATVKASEAGLLGPDFVAGVTMHSGNEWVYEANKALISQGNDWFINLITAEEHSFTAADLAMFPSESLHEIVGSYGWRLERAKKLPYLVPTVPSH